MLMRDIFTVMKFTINDMIININHFNFNSNWF